MIENKKEKDKQDKMRGNQKGNENNKRDSWARGEKIKE